MIAQRNFKKEEVDVSIDSGVKPEGYDKENFKKDNRDIIEQFVELEAPDKNLQKLALLSKIAGGISLVSLIMAFILLGTSLTTNAVSDSSLGIKNIATIFLFTVGLLSFLVAKNLERKMNSSKKVTKKKNKAKRKTKKKG
ncbi:MAG TPA: hypothetical protein VJH92_01625 [Candidatus Nanoarchaeia archaeon]|nr:hypothetical protein [Candidatus Nanoarchaeia archaeon]